MDTLKRIMNYITSSLLMRYYTILDLFVFVALLQFSFWGYVILWGIWILVIAPLLNAWYLSITKKDE